MIELFVYYLLGSISTIITSIAVFYLVISQKSFILRKNFQYLLIFFIIFSVYLVIGQLLKYYTLHFYVDFAWSAQILNSTITTGKPLCLNEEFFNPGTLNYLSVHFTPLIYLIAIPFKIWPYAQTMIVINYMLLFSSIIPLYKLAYLYNKDRIFCLFVVTSLLWYPTFQYTTLYGFEMLRFSIPIILWMLYFWHKKKYSYYFLFVLLSVLVREEVGLTIMMLGIYQIFFEKERKIGTITACTGLGAFILINQYIMPYLRGGPSDYLPVAYSSFERFGNSFGEIIVNIFRHPSVTISIILRPIKLANVFMLFLPLSFIPLFSLSTLMCILANISVGLLSQTHLYVSYMLYYITPSIPFIFLAFIKGWAKLSGLINKYVSKRISRPSEEINQAAMIAVFSGLIVTNVFFGPSPLSLQFWSKDIKTCSISISKFSLFILYNK